jgi:hypothetical protein
VFATVLLDVAVLTLSAGWAAGWSASATGIATTGTGSWGLVATQSLGTPTSKPLTLSYLVPVVGGPSPQYLTVVNTGSAALTGGSYHVDVSGGGLLSATTVALTACVGATWNGGTCSGTKQTLGTWSASSSQAVASTVVPTAPGGRLSVQAAVGGSGIVGGTITAVVSVKVSAGQPRQIRAATAKLV